MFRLLCFCVGIGAVVQEIWGSALPVKSNENLGVSGGDTVDIDSAPFMAALLYMSPRFSSPKQFCGGAIIHERFILTAAHCIAHIPSIRNVRIFVGSDRLPSKKNAVMIKVEKKFCHKKYQLYHFDICLLKLKERVPFGPRVVKAELPDKNFKITPGTYVNITGWGDTEEDEDITNLRQVSVPIVSETTCRNKFDNLDDLQICAGSRGKDACSGDSGGPLTYRNKVIGIVSYGQMCSHYSDGVGVYTKVTGYLNWINNIIRKHS